MLWGERVKRRRALVVILVAFALADLALAFAVLGGDGWLRLGRLPYPMRPVTGDLRSRRHADVELR